MFKDFGLSFLLVAFVLVLFHNANVGVALFVTTAGLCVTETHSLHHVFPVFADCRSLNGIQIHRSHQRLPLL